MIFGRFGGTSSCPYIEADVRLTRLAVAGGVSFVVDTGADMTVLMLADALQLGIDYKLLGPSETCDGIGGSMLIYTEPAIVTFMDDSKLFEFIVAIQVGENDPKYEQYPSLLGRDVLSRMHMDYDPAKLVLSFDVVNADTVLPI